jgi:hypothetical protein
LLSLIPKPSNSLVMMAKSFSGFKTSSTMKMRLQVRATAMTCRPRPFPSLAPSMIPAKVYQETYRSKRVGHTWQIQDLDSSSVVRHSTGNCCQGGELVRGSFRVRSTAICQRMSAGPIAWALAHVNFDINVDFPLEEISESACRRPQNGTHDRGESYESYTSHTSSCHIETDSWATTATATGRVDQVSSEFGQLGFQLSQMVSIPQSASAFLQFS